MFTQFAHAQSAPEPVQAPQTAEEVIEAFEHDWQELTSTASAEEVGQFCALVETVLVQIMSQNCRSVQGDDEIKKRCADLGRVYKHVNGRCTSYFSR
jgi:hypothetical protein